MRKPAGISKTPAGAGAWEKSVFWVVVAMRTTVCMAGAAPGGVGGHGGVEGDLGVGELFGFGRGGRPGA